MVVLLAVHSAVLMADVLAVPLADLWVVRWDDL